jgi:hypothetical protein
MGGYFAVIDGNLVPILGAFVTMLVGFYALAKLMLGQAVKDRDADRNERLRLADAIEKMAENSGKNAENMGKLAEYTKEGNAQSEVRNGHLGELILKQGEQMQTIAEKSTERVVTAVQTIHSQHIEHAHIEHEHIKSKEVDQ